MKKLIPLLLLFVSLPSLAQRQFDIEVIIFKRSVDIEKTSESWPSDVADIEMSRTGRFTDAGFLQSKGVTLLSPEQYQLNEQVNKLNRHAGFEVLLHKAWRQGDQNRQGAPIFHIQAGDNFAGQFNPDGSERIPGQNNPVIEGVTETNLDQPLYELDGKLQVYVEHYLYADVMLDVKSPSVRQVMLEQPELQLDMVDSDDNAVVQAGLLEEVSPTVIEERFLKHYRLDQKRRMRSTETHYLDHPLLGVIIQVRRVESDNES
ncbi:peptidoglycan binding protein CsiV [Vibrio sp.]|uniref:peptidoglycan binding protein CsiV n=1 Tax=Vibrio sp. TaxID=678 RepID=UPI003D14AC48